MRGEVLSTPRYVHTVTPLSSNSAIISAAAASMTTALFEQVDLTQQAKGHLPKFLATSLGLSLRSYTQETIEKFLRTSEFRVLWIQANTQAHEAILAAVEGKPSPFIRPDGSIDINLSNAILAARTALGNAGLDAFEKVDPGSLRSGIVIARPASIGRVRHGVQIVKLLAVALPVLALVLYGLAFAISRERRRTVVRAGIGLLAAGAAGLVAIAVGRS